MVPIRWQSNPHQQLRNPNRPMDHRLHPGRDEPGWGSDDQWPSKLESGGGECSGHLLPQKPDPGWPHDQHRRSEQKWPRSIDPERHKHQSRRNDHQQRHNPDQQTPDQFRDRQCLEWLCAGGHGGDQRNRIDPGRRHSATRSCRLRNPHRWHPHNNLECLAQLRTWHSRRHHQRIHPGQRKPNARRAPQHLRFGWIHLR